MTRVTTNLASTAMMKEKRVNELIASYQLGALEVGEIQSEIDAALSSPEFLQTEAARLDVSIDSLKSVRFRAESEGGFVAESIIISILVGAASSLTADAVKALWRSVAKKIKDKGEDALGPEEPTA